MLGPDGCCAGTGSRAGLGPHPKQDSPWQAFSVSFLFSNKCYCCGEKGKLHPNCSLCQVLLHRIRHGRHLELWEREKLRNHVGVGASHWKVILHAFLCKHPRSVGVGEEARVCMWVHVCACVHFFFLLSHILWLTIKRSLFPWDSLELLFLFRYRFSAFRFPLLFQVMNPQLAN